MNASAFLAQSREYLSDHYLPKIRAAVEPLSDSDLWWRPNEASNSIGNLLLHLAGNIRQWLVSGVGQTPGQRDRAGEFAQREPLPRELLLTTLGAAVREADAVLARLDPAELEAPRAIQGRDVTVLEAVYHVVEHLAMHAGQIFYIAKLRSGKELGFYRMEAGIPRADWPGHPTNGSA
jgi:uncharacterized damage-inducible protein DinB